MARGWESKDIEDQQQAAEERASAASRPKLTVEQVAAEQKRDGLLLQRTRILREIAASTTDRHRATLQSGLAYLDQQLTELGWKAAD